MAACDGATATRLKERIVAGADLAWDGVVAFAGSDAQRILREEFDIECSLSSTYRLLPRGTRVELWFEDEARIGQKTP